MRLSWCAIAFFAVDSLGGALATTNAPRCSAYPEAQALIQHCSTGSAFCTDYLGRGPSTVHVTKTRTQTSIIASTTTAVITDTITSTDATVTTADSTTTTSTYVTTTCGSNHKRAIQPRAYGPSCGVKGTIPPPSAGVSAACSCLIDQTSNSFVTKTITAYGTAVTTIDSYTTTTEFQTATVFSTVDSPSTGTITITPTGPPQSVTASAPQAVKTYTQYFIGTRVTENPNNVGNVNTQAPPITTSIATPSDSGACALHPCAEFAATNLGPEGSGYDSFDLHYLVNEGMWQCIAYYDPSDDPADFDVANADVGDVYGYSLYQESIPDGSIPDG